MTRVIVHIERLVLAGLRTEDRHRITSGLQDELGRLLGSRQALARLGSAGDRPQLKVAGVVLAPGATARQIGGQLARGIGRGLQR